MNSRGIITTILVIELILLMLLTFSALNSQRTTFQDEINMNSIAAFRITSSYDNIAFDVSSLKAHNADNATLDQYIYFVTSTFNNYSSSNLTLNRTDLSVSDANLGMQKVGKL